MKSFVIIAKKNEKSNRIKQEVKEKLLKHGWKYNKQFPELIICIGGDGTLLYAVHKYLSLIDQVKFVAIHTGTLGFFTDYTDDEVAICIDDILYKEPCIVSSPLLKIDIYGDTHKTKYALNEMRIENIKKTQILDVTIDDEYFETCRGSGICLSTQAGSTAYNRSLNGAVIDSGLSLMQLAEITGIQHSKHRSLRNPYILHNERKVMFYSSNFHSAFLCYDHLTISLKDAEKVQCEIADKCVKFARYREYSYLSRLKNLY
ncbi:MAG: NAD kinase [Erysipelotrichaceae bacterium]|nr:NAD kinase [Erysipelotrichaceae bacterium]